MAFIDTFGVSGNLFEFLGVHGAENLIESDLLEFENIRLSYSKL